MKARLTLLAMLTMLVACSDDNSASQQPIDPTQNPDVQMDAGSDTISTPDQSPDANDATDEDATDDDATDEDATNEDATDDDATDDDATAPRRLDGYDDVIEALMARWDVPGGAVALTYEGRLVHVRGFGRFDSEQPDAETPADALFRIASLSKAITAVAIMKLVEDGLVELDAPAFDYLPHLPAPEGATPDPRLASVTVRHLLHHAGGWDRDISGDPMFRAISIANQMGETPPASADLIVRHMRGQPLDFAPGARYAYSNFGYAVLGRIIEAVTGEGYEPWVKDNVLTPMGISRMQIGRTRFEERANGEVEYFTYPGEPQARVSVFPDVDGPVPRPYGGWYQESLDAHGGWIASAIDLSRFLLATDGRDTYPDLLSPASTATLIERPTMDTWRDSAYWYAMGFSVRPAGQDANWWHTGSLPGTSTIFVRTHHGYTWVALFNTRPEDRSFFSEMDRAMWDAMRAIEAIPTHNLFDDAAD